MSSLPSAKMENAYAAVRLALGPTASTSPQPDGGNRSPSGMESGKLCTLRDGPRFDTGYQTRPPRNDRPSYHTSPRFFFPRRQGAHLVAIHLHFHDIATGAEKRRFPRPARWRVSPTRNASPRPYNPEKKPEVVFADMTP